MLLFRMPTACCSSGVIDANAAALSMAHPQRFSQFAGRFGLPHAEQISRQGNGVAAFVAGGEVGPFSGAQVDAKGAEPVVAPGGIPGHPFSALSLAVREPALQQDRQGLKRRRIYRWEVQSGIMGLSSKVSFSFASVVASDRGYYFFFHGDPLLRIPKHPRRVRHCEPVRAIGARLLRVLMKNAQSFYTAAPILFSRAGSTSQD